MTQMPSPGTIPAWDIADRLSKSLHHSGIRVQEMADYLGVSRNTVGNYLSRRTSPDRRTLLLWAMRTGVPQEWLETGTAPFAAGPLGVVGAGNQRPSGNQDTRQYLGLYDANRANLAQMRHLLPTVSTPLILAA